MLNGVSVFWGVFSCRKEELDAANKLNKQSSAWMDPNPNPNPNHVLLYMRK